MLSQYSIPTIPQNLSKEETIVQIVEVLDHLNVITQDIFSKIKHRIQANSDSLSGISKRVNDVASKVESLKSDNKAKTVFSSSKYPAADVNKDYVSIFQDASHIKLKRHEVEHTKFSSTYEPLSKLQFYHVKSTIPETDTVSEGLGDISNDLKFVNDLLLVNSGKNLYVDFELTDSLKGQEIIRDRELISTSEIGDAPYSISQRSSLHQSNKDNYFYTPKVEELPALDVPMDLPDLPGIADDLRYEVELSSSIAPSALNQNENITLDLPNVIDLLTSEISPPPPPPPPEEVPELPVSQSFTKKNDSISVPNIEDHGKNNSNVTLPETTINSGSVLSENVPDTPVLITLPNDPRASLMDAIRKAGGTQKANLKRTKAIENSPSKISSSGDLMADLHSKLMMRRKGISGAKSTEQGNNFATFTPDSTLSRISSMIPPPTKRTDVESSVSTDDDEDWND